MFKPTPKKKEPGSNYSIWLPDPTRMKLAAMAKENDLTAHNLIRQMILHCLEEK